MEGNGIVLNAMPVEHLGDDLRHRQLLENSLVVAELQVMQGRDQGQVITGQAFAGLTDPNVFDTPVQPFAVQAELKERRLAEQAFQIEVRILADQLHLDRVQGTDGFSTVERQHLEIVANRGNQQLEMRSIGRREHTLIL
ncbi:hypothetical protein D3C77_576930 [compost metagenome]